MKHKIDNYLKTRSLCVFIVFIFINILANLPYINLYADIFSHFKLQYIIVNILFFVIFIYLSFNNKKFIVCGIISILLICINFKDITPYIGNTPKFESKNTIKIALYNVLTQNKEYNKLTSQISSEMPDIIITQEVDYNWLKSINKLKKDYPYYIEHPRDDNFGIALYSKFPLHNASVENWTDYEVPVINTEIKISDKNIKLYCIHTLPPTSKEYLRIRNEMLKKIHDLKKENQNTPLIIAGDLNTTIYSFSYKKHIQSANFKEAQSIRKNIAGTWNSKFLPIFRISLEHILVNSKLNVIEFKIGKYFGSDHLPIFVNIGF